MYHLRPIFQLLAFIVFFLLISSCGFKADSRKLSQPGTGTLPESTVEFLNDYEHRFDKLFNASKVPGAVVTIVKDGKIFCKGFGRCKADNSQVVDCETIFRIGSLSKGFAGALSSVLVAENIMSWNDKVVESVPNFILKDSSQTSRINVKHLLSHSTGLQRHAYTNLIEAGQSIDKIIPNFKKLDLISEEGKIYAYSNASFSVIEKVIEQKTGKSFDQVLKEKILFPANMCNASTDYKTFKNNRNKAFPHYYDSRKKRFASRRISKKYYNTISAAGINASGQDMGQWLKVLLGNEPDICSEEMLTELFTPVLETKSNKYYDRWSELPAQYALGWRVLNFENFQLIHHSGYVNHYRSEIAIDRKSNLGICVLFNAFSPEANHVVPEFLKSRKKLLDSEESKVIKKEPENPAL